MKLFEAYVDKEGLKNFTFDKINKLYDFINNNAVSLENMDIDCFQSDDGDFAGFIKGDNFVNIGISKNNKNIIFSYNLGNGNDGEFVINDITDDDIFKLLIKYLGIGEKNIDIKDFKNDKIDFSKTDTSLLASENEEITEKKKSIHTTNTTPEASIDINKQYNTNNIDNKFKDENPYYDHVDSKRIEIGEEDPVKKFREWNAKYWRKDKDKDKKYEPDSGVEEEETTKPLDDKNNKKIGYNNKNTCINYKDWSHLKK